MAEVHGCCASDLPDAAFGDPGAGGGFADPTNGIAFGGVTNPMPLGVDG